MRPLSHLLLALVTDQPLSRDDRWQLAVLLLQLLRRSAPPRPLP
jgi:hypothetical protein